MPKEEYKGKGSGWKVAHTNINGMVIALTELDYYFRGTIVGYWKQNQVIR